MNIVFIRATLPMAAPTAGLDDGTIVVKKTDTGETLRTLRGHGPTTVGSLLTLSDGRFVSACDDSFLSQGVGLAFTLPVCQARGQVPHRLLLSCESEEDAIRLSEIAALMLIHAL